MNNASFFYIDFRNYAEDIKKSCIDVNSIKGRKNMFQRILAVLLLFVLIAGPVGQAYADAAPLKSGGASLLVPGLGQYLNDDQATKGGKIKMAAMIIIEIGGIVATAVLGGTVGSPLVWAVGVSILAANHLWSATDAYMRAGNGSGVSAKGTGAR
ncbi:MAG: hypothetical protein A3B72_03285 [Omnitrophica bacterium RIFCSPHIGHO2_02_FULL_45_28]|nr:MAG: hypothetical protein A3B72_03285 [Omnitrophica bacterium RIFCSPHIGHO2_02_FULL_45_28]